MATTHLTVGPADVDAVVVPAETTPRLTREERRHLARAARAHRHSMRRVRAEHREREVREEHLSRQRRVALAKRERKAHADPRALMR